MTLSEKELKLVNDPTKWTPVQSSNLEAVLFIPGTQNRGRLFIRFKGNKHYFYEEVPKRVFKEFMNSSSKGHYLNDNIKPNYACYSIK